MAIHDTFWQLNDFACLTMAYKLHLLCSNQLKLTFKHIENSHINCLFTAITKLCIYVIYVCYVVMYVTFMIHLVCC